MLHEASRAVGLGQHDHVGAVHLCVADLHVRQRLLLFLPAAPGQETTAGGDVQVWSCLCLCTCLCACLCVKVGVYVRVA